MLFAPLPSGITNPIATLTYHTVVGSTLAPEVRVEEIISSATCPGAASTDPVVIPLLPFGCELTTVQVTPFASRIVSIVPNPAPGAPVQIMFEVVEKVPVHIELSDALGDRVRTITDETLDPGRYAVTVDLEGLAAGIYLMTYQAGRTRDERTLLLER